MKFLAVSTNSGDPRPFLEEESAGMAELTRSGRVTDGWLKADWSGAVLVLDASDPAAAREAVDALPLVRHGLTSFTVVEIVDMPQPG